MKPLSELGLEQINKIKLISFDSDGVLSEKGTEIHQNTTGLYSQQTNLISPVTLDKLNRLKKYISIVINSGRNSQYLSQIYQAILWNNISFISEIGTFIVDNGLVLQTEALSDYELKTINNIRRELGKFIGDPRVEGFEPKQFLTTLHCVSEVPEVVEIVKQNDPENKFYCWWNLEAYDINPSKFTKTNALKKLISQKGINPDEVMVVGNGINDRDSVTSNFLNVSTDSKNLVSDDYFIDGEHLGGEILIDKLLELLEN
jgi:hydroxymethylpyrimidine pyrophosphatase-like HAD family hydrolase